MREEAEKAYNALMQMIMEGLTDDQSLEAANAFLATYEACTVKDPSELAEFISTKVLHPQEVADFCLGILAQHEDMKMPALRLELKEEYGVAL